MARIKYSGLVDSIRGSIGGTTFQANRYGFTIKRKPNMIRPWTANQKEMQVYFSQAVRAWGQLDNTGRSNWDTFASTIPQYAKHNPSAQLSGFACFVKNHAYRFLGGVGVESSPGLTVPELPALSYSLVLNTGVLSLNVTCSNSNEDWDIFCFLSRPFLPAQNFIGTRTRFIVYTTSDTQSLNITTAYAAKYGALPVVGARVALDTVLAMENGGQVNSRVQEILTVAAP